jgi:hypothetical protein
MNIKEKERSVLGMCIRSTSDRVSKGQDIQNSYIPLNLNDMRSIADITKLGKIPACIRKGSNHGRQ